VDWDKRANASHHAEFLAWIRRFNSVRRPAIAALVPTFGITCYRESLEKIVDHSIGALKRRVGDGIPNGVANGDKRPLPCGRHNAGYQIDDKH
jgi:hypothetical protein